uniref:DExD/H-box helicase 60 n=1 Tax=Rhinolophus ferrumequinum TaxID=59479 RepID=A0A671ESY7_RHIFE
MKSSHLMVSLFKDFVESEFLLVDGDSLFITCAFNVNFKKGQTLHFFYIVERFLHDLIQKEAKFVIVFFKDAENMYFNYPVLLALRTTLIQHLEYNTDVTVHTEFSNCLSPEWELFLKECYPYFLIVSEEGITPHQTDFLNIFIIHALQKKINIVQSLGIESDVLRTYGHCTLSSYSHKQFFEMNFKNFLLQVHQTLSLLQNLWPEGADIRSVVCSISCSVTLKLYKKMLQDNPPTLNEAADLCRMYCLSVIFLQYLPLFQRAKSRIITYIWDRTLPPFLRMLNRCQVFILKQLKAKNNWNVNFTGLPDLTDNSLWKNIAYYYEIEYSRGLNLGLGDTLMQEYQKLWNTVLTLSEDSDLGGPMPMRTTSRLFLSQTKTSPRGSNQEIHKLGLIPLKAEIIDDYAGDILSEVPFLSSDDPAVTSLCKKKEFDELIHWHSHRPLSDDFERTRCNSDAKRRRDIQKLHHYYHVFGKSLIGSNRSVRIIRGRALPPPENSSVQKTRKHQTNAEKFIEENQKRQLAKLEKREVERWNNLSLHIEKEIKENPNSGIKRLEDFLQTCSVKSVKFTAEMVGLDACFKFWMEYCLKAEAESRDISIIINLMKRIHVIYEKYSELLQNTHRQKLAKYLKYIGFDNLAQSLSPQVDESGIKKDISKYSVHMGAARFQLTYMGPYLFREERSDPDPRVHRFIPDTWQRELLDVVDNNESAVIVAPTSSGKTYASYYCMEKILRESDEGVVVYVSPTKALVNQVVGTVCSLFTKALPKGLVVCGVFTRDYRHDTLNCQILVTVPQCLEILLLSPHHQQWVKRIRYVIFDEVHCLGGEIGAEVWEHLLVMIRSWILQNYKLHCLLRRGIGYHHGSMEYKQRQVVEMLFRLKHIKVVTATSSLALGINMPCKSVVFTEDSVFLDALNFRQMSGRAGRRGEDLIGNVFFYGIPLPKVERLLKSDVPKLKGQFPLSISLVLRLMLLVAKADDKKDAKAKALSVLQHSLMSFKKPNIECMLKFYFIYSLQFLVTEGYLNQECIPIGYSGLVSHLHYHEPANFVLVSFLEKCLFHKLCIPVNIDGQKRFSSDVMETLVVVLANLFGRLYLPPCEKKLKKRFPHSVVILDELPKEFADVVKEHNNRIEKNFGSFLLTISKLADMRKEYQLPLSEIDFSGKEYEESELVSHLMPGTESRTAVSPFACLSNITDQDLFDIDVVNDAMFQTIDVNDKNIPILCLEKRDKKGRKCPLNGYVLNFYKTGSLSLNNVPLYVYIQFIYPGDEHLGCLNFWLL